jgi:hypothetical protein
MPGLINNVIDYLDLQFGRRPVAAVPHKGSGPAPTFPVLPQYLALAAGIAVQPFLNHYIETHQWSVSWGAVIAQIVFGFLMAICIFPGVYRNAFDRTKPLFVQLCTIFTAGLGWESLFKTAVAAGGG